MACTSGCFEISADKITVFFFQTEESATPNKKSAVVAPSKHQEVPTLKGTVGCLLLL